MTSDRRNIQIKILQILQICKAIIGMFFFSIYKLLAATNEERRKKKGAPGIEPGTSRSAVECSTTELYPLELIRVVEIMNYIKWNNSNLIKFWCPGPATLLP